jgi:hypothetical protein
MDGYLDTQLNGSCHPLFTVIDAGNGLLDSVETHTNCDGAQPAIPDAVEVATSIPIYTEIHLT